jgi:catechol 2,3-dioxygenase-like lactoylglutathione lyase family enzyme
MTHSTTETETDALVSGALPTVFVADLDRAVRFYTETLGLGLFHRADDEFAMIDAGGGMQIGLHPATAKGPKPGTHGSISIGLNVTRPIEQVVTTLKQRGVTFHGPVVDDDPVKLAFFGDPDGNDLYLCETKNQESHKP